MTQTQSITQPLTDASSCRTPGCTQVLGDHCGECDNCDCTVTRAGASNTTARCQWTRRVGVAYPFSH